MRPNPRSHPSPRARAVAEAPIGALLARVDELSRRWAITLILERPLERIAELHLEMVAREAPALCAQMIRALESDTELEQLAGGEAADGRGQSAAARKLVMLAGAGGAGSAAETVEAVEALRGVLWDALLDELRWPACDWPVARQVADLGDRLAYVCATVLATAVAVADAGATEEVAEVVAQEPASIGADSGLGVSDSHRSPVGPRRAILIDEREQAETAPARPRHSEPRDQPAVEPRQPRPLPWDPPARRSEAVSGASVDAPSRPINTPSRPLDAPRPGAIDAPRGQADPSARQLDAPDGDTAPPADGRPQGTGPGARGDGGKGPEIEVRDERGEEGPAAWIGSIGRQLERFEQDGLPFAVLLVELGDEERLRRAALPGAMSSLTSRIERALVQELQRMGGHPAQRHGRPAGTLTCERPGRYWLLAAATDAIAARRLAEWVVQTIGPLAGRRWAPLDVMIGIAVCPDDGRDAAALAAQADLGLYAPRPAGR
jgi:GGDEF domain-containing protein